MCFDHARCSSHCLNVNGGVDVADAMIGWGLNIAEIVPDLACQDLTSNFEM